jgi:endo-1,4-beta-xylanase
MKQGGEVAMKRPHQDGIRVEAGRTALTRREVIGGGLAAAGSLALAGNALAGQAAGLAEAWRRHFRIGVAMSNQMLDRDGGPDLDIIARDFNSVTAENAMKWGEIQPDGVNWRWQRADQLVNFAAKHNMHVLGHTLVWHSQVPRSLFTGADGAPLARAGLLGRMEEHINAMVGRYKGRVHTWDVVNEAIDEGKGWRTSQWQTTWSRPSAWRARQTRPPNCSTTTTTCTTPPSGSSW